MLSIVLFLEDMALWDWRELVLLFSKLSVLKHFVDLVWLLMCLAVNLIFFLQLFYLLSFDQLVEKILDISQAVSISIFLGKLIHNGSSRHEISLSFRKYWGDCVWQRSRSLVNHLDKFFLILLSFVLWILSFNYGHFQLPVGLCEILVWDIWACDSKPHLSSRKVFELGELRLAHRKRCFLMLKRLFWGASSSSNEGDVRVHEAVDTFTLDAFNSSVSNWAWFHHLIVYGN